MHVGGRGLAALRALRVARGAKSYLDKAARKAIWNLNPMVRGLKIEQHLAVTEYAGWYHVGATRRGFFELIDFQKGRTLVSLKTVNTRSGGWVSRMKRHIKELRSSGATLDGRPANLVLDLRVQPGGIGDAQQIVQFGRAKAIDVRVKEFN
jgi:hypothetical protein